MTALCKSWDGNYFLAGQYPDSARRALLFFKIKENGDSLKTMVIGDYKHVYYTTNTLIRTPDGNHLLTRHFENLDTGNTNALLVQLTNNLDTLWTRKYDASPFGRFWSTALSDDSGYLSVGEVLRTSSSNFSSIFILKTDKNGKELWRKKYDYGSTSSALSVTITKNGNILLSGFTGPNSFLMKLNNLGNKIWFKPCPYKGAFTIHELPNSNLYITGHYGVDLGENALVGVLDSSGNEIYINSSGWQKDNTAWHNVKLKNGAISAGYNVNGSSYKSGWLLRTDEKGDSLWSMNYTLDSFDCHYFSGIAQTSDGGFIMSGENYDWDIRKQSIWVVKVDSLGCLVSGCNPIGIKEVGSSPKHLIVYPNPSSQSVSVMYSSRNANSIIISDNMGKTIFTQKLRSPQNEILLDISNYSSGLYRVSILNKSGEILMSKKLVKY